MPEEMPKVSEKTKEQLQKYVKSGFAGPYALQHAAEYTADIIKSCEEAARKIEMLREHNEV